MPESENDRELTGCSLPMGNPRGPLIRLPKRIKMGRSTTSRIVTFVMETSSSNAPSTVSSANPRQWSKTQFEMAMFLF